MPLLNLPLELFTQIISYLNLRDKSIFARSSKSCYRLLFPSRFPAGIGLKISSETTNYLKPFSKGGWLESSRYSIRSITASHTNIPALRDLLSSTSIFPNIQNLTLTLTLPTCACLGFERIPYLSLLKTLSSLPYFQNLKSLSLDLLPQPPIPNPTESKEESNPSWLQYLFHRSPPQRLSCGERYSNKDYLKKYIYMDEASVVALETLEFPESLRECRIFGNPEGYMCKEGRRREGRRRYLGQQYVLYYK